VGVYVCFSFSFVLHEISAWLGSSSGIGSQAGWVGLLYIIWETLNLSASAVRVGLQVGLRLGHGWGMAAQNGAMFCIAVLGIFN